MNSTKEKTGQDVKPSVDPRGTERSGGNPAQPVRILFISPQPFFEWRGSSIRVKFNVMALGELGYDVDLLTLPIGADEPGLPGNVIRVWNPFNAKKISIGPSGLKLWFDLLLFIKGAGLVLGNRYAVIHGTEEAGTLSYLLSLLGKGKSVYEKHSDTGSYKGGGKLKNAVLNAYHRVENFTIKRASITITTGPGLTEQAKQASPTKPIFTIPDIPSSIVEPDPDHVLKTRAELIDHDQQIIVTYVGSFASYQGIDIIFDCISGVVAQNSNIKFLIIGGDDAQIAFHQRELAEKGVSVKGENPQVVFPGKIAPDKLPAYLQASDILLAPRKSGINSPLKILDYFKAGAAIVATNTIANQRLLNESNAELCEFHSDAFARSILNLASDPDRRALLGKNGRESYLSTYNFSVFKQQLKQAYELVAPLKNPSAK